MPGIIRCDQIDLNNAQIVNNLLTSLSDALANPSNRFDLSVVGKYYFSTPTGPITNDSGWYILCSGGDKTPIYVGKARDLNYRLNTKDGSRDNFANPQRVSDDARNIIKKLVTIGVIPSLIVYVIPEPFLCQKMSLASPLTDLDIGNVEKVINLYRSILFS